jgi:hypothetical protein
MPARPRFGRDSSCPLPAAVASAVGVLVGGERGRHGNLGVLVPALPSGRRPGGGFRVSGYGPIPAEGTAHEIPIAQWDHVGCAQFLLWSARHSPAPSPRAAQVHSTFSPLRGIFCRGDLNSTGFRKAWIALKTRVQITVSLHGDMSEVPGFWSGCRAM